MKSGAPSSRVRKSDADNELSYGGQRRQRYDAMMAVLCRGVDEKRDALSHLGALMERILDPPAGNVVDLSTKKKTVRDGG